MDEYRCYLLQERGLAKTSLLNYLPFAEQLLSDRFGQLDMNLSELTAQDVTKFLQDRARQLRPGAGRLTRCAASSAARSKRRWACASIRPSCRTAGAPTASPPSSSPDAATRYTGRAALLSYKPPRGITTPFVLAKRIDPFYHSHCRHKQVADHAFDCNRGLCGRVRSGTTVHQRRSARNRAKYLHDRREVGVAWKLDRKCFSLARCHYSHKCADLNP